MYYALLGYTPRFKNTHMDSICQLEDFWRDRIFGCNAEYQKYLQF